MNTELVARYWELGEYLSRKIASVECGDGAVDDLAADLARRRRGARGYTRPNLIRMRQFVAEYQTFLLPKELLRAKLHELYAQLVPMDDAPTAARGTFHG